MSGAEERSPLLEFADLMRHLRQTCVWKAEQTHALSLIHI